LHPETFWLGYAAGTAAGWRPNSPDPEESVDNFYKLFLRAKWRWRWIASTT
jgi:hypothetical protein